MRICFSARNLQIWRFLSVSTVLIILLMDDRNIISFANIWKKNYLTRFDEIWNCYFLLNYVTRFPENQSDSESRIVRLIGNIFLGSRVSEEKNFLNQPIRSHNRLWRPCLLVNRDKMSNLDRWPFIDASYQVSVHLSEGF